MADTQKSGGELFIADTNVLEPEMGDLAYALNGLPPDEIITVEEASR